MDRETYIRAVLESVFSGHKEELIESAVNMIMAYRPTAEEDAHGGKGGHGGTIETICRFDMDDIGRGIPNAKGGTGMKWDEVEE